MLVHTSETLRQEIGPTKSFSCGCLTPSVGTLTSCRRHMGAIFPRSETVNCNTLKPPDTQPMCSIIGTKQRLPGFHELAWPDRASSTGTASSTRVSPTATPPVRRHVATITRAIWACTSIMTWLLLLASQSYTTGVSAATPDRQTENQYDSAFSPDQTQCIHSLLLDRYRIPPEAFTATSDLGESSGTSRYAAENLRSEKTERAWCPNRRVGSELNEFVQVDMSELNAITKIVISGLHAEEGGSRFTPYFYIRYKREASEPEWRTYRQRDADRTSRLIGSTTALVPKFVVLDPPLIARWIRIYPYRDSPGFVCVRLEAYGCRFTDDLVEYQIPEGSLAVPPHHAIMPTRQLSVLTAQSSSTSNTNNRTVYYEAGSGAAFSDSCYDGYRVEPGGLLDGGLGCLTDLAIAPKSTTPMALRSSLLTPSMDDVIPTGDNHWFVGWHRGRWRATKSATQVDDVVDMLFRFASVRDFKRLRLYASNNYPAKVRLPRRIEVRFSVRGSLFSGQPVVAQDFPMINHSTGLSTLELDLEGRIGQFLQLKAFFADDWLLFSEIKFYSHVATEPIMVDEPPVPRRSKKEPSTPNVPRGTESTALPVESFDLTSVHRLPTVIILALLIAAFLVVIGCAFIWIYWKRKHLREVKHRRDFPLSPDVRMDPGDTGTNGRLGVIFPVNSQLLNANETLPRKCPLNNSNEVRHLRQLKQTVVTARTISNHDSRLSGTTGPSDEFSETDPFNTSGLPTAPMRGHDNPNQEGLIASVKRWFGQKRKYCPRRVSSPGRCAPVGFDSVQATSTTTALSNLEQNNMISGLYNPNAVQAYPNNLNVFHGQVPNPSGPVTFPGQTVQAGGPVTSVLPLELSNPTASVMLFDGPTSNPTLMHVSTSALPGSDLHSNAWRLQTTGGVNLGTTNPTGTLSTMRGSNQPELGLYTTVSGESDGDSNCASTMSPEYATASNINEQLGFSNTLSQLHHHNQHGQQLQQQQAAAAALLTFNPACSTNNMRGHMTYMPPRQTGLISPSLTFSALPTSTTMTNRAMTQPGPLILSNPNGGVAQLIATRPMDLASGNSAQFYQAYSSSSPVTISSCVAANYSTEGMRHLPAVGSLSNAVANPVLFTRINGVPVQQSLSQQRQQQQTPRLMRQKDGNVSNEFSGDPSTENLALGREHGRTRYRTCTTDDGDPWIPVSFVKSNRLDAVNGEHYLSSLRPPIPPSPPPPPPSSKSQITSAT